MRVGAELPGLWSPAVVRPPDQHALGTVAVSDELLPVGRRVAYWRGRRKLSQQVFADRLGKSKSWVDKVERGVRALDKLSTLQEIAAVLRIDAAVLLGRDARPADVTERAEGVDRIGTALSTYEIALGRPTRHPAYRIAPPDLASGTPAELSLCGTLLLQAALAAARTGDHRTTADLIAEAATLASRVGDGHDHHRTGFGPVAVDLARAAAAVDLGDAHDAITWHRKATARDGWRWLPAEHRAAHLLDAARAYLHTDDPANAGRTLLDAHRTASAEVRHRPAARTLLARVARDPHAPGTIVQLAGTLGVT
ncbi:MULTISPECIES: helix-turn-helix domain-containing protein [unclassified Micromonospora]|uniref:helix-turn-helix domain-containing protein n=1 Tax=unclassified Micromonospora TaxID=2617518 RepID=UPI00362D0FB7